MKNKTFLSRFGFAMNGFVSTIKGEASFRFQIFAAIGAFSLLAVMGARPLWWAIFSLVIGSILSAELMNTAIEHLIDRLHPEIHPSMKLAKDCAAGAVLVLSFVSLIVLASFIYERFLG
jgi:diacylglycerol kinase (ATP)